MPPSPLTELIWTANAEPFLQQFGVRIGASLRADVARLVASPDPLGRLLGALRLAVELCHGLDAHRGLTLSKDLLRLLARDFERLQLADEQLLRELCASALNAHCQALFLEGPWEQFVPVLVEASRTFPFLPQHDGYWNAVSMAARALVRQNRVPEAKVWLAAVPFPEKASAPQVELARRELVSFERQRFEVELRQSVAEQADAIWNQDFQSIAVVLRRLLQQLHPTATDATQAARRDELVGVLRDTEVLAELAERRTPFDLKYEQLTEQVERWHERLRRCLRPETDWNHVDFEWLGRCLHRAAAIHGATTPDSEATAAVLRDLDIAEGWTARAGDVHGRWMVGWARLLVLEKVARRAPAAEALAALIAELNERRATLSDEETRSNVANFFPGLASKAIKVARPGADRELVAAACELRKSRSLLATRADVAISSPLAVAGPQALGANTHYLAYVVLEHDNRIEAVFYTADGAVTAEPVAVDVRLVRRLHGWLDPAKWRQPRLNPIDLRAALSELTRPIATALRSGRVQPGDHICIAADDPVHQIPLHYLPVGDALAVQVVSMSRVASFSDAQQIVSQLPVRPTASSAFFLPSWVKQPALKLGEFHRVAAVLASLCGPCHGTTAPLTGPELMRELGPHKVLHIDAHGTFPPRTNPYYASGLLVSDGKGVPGRGGDLEHLLSPAQVIEGKPQLAGSHVTLSACVSGSGVEGRGGDVLGMELALRLCGASSVLATHWDVLTASASAFSREFYARWLGAGASRARAWRESIETLMGEERDPVDAAQWCMFSLYGDWR